MSERSLVLLHGWGLSARVWDSLSAALAPGIAVYAPDLPGHGSAAPANTASLAAWAEHVVAAMPDGAVLCGWSLGGLIALEIARRWPGKLSALILIDSSPCFVVRNPTEADAPWPHGVAAETVNAFVDDFARDPDGTLRRFIALQALGDARRRAVGTALAEALSSTDGPRARALGDGLEILAHTDLRPLLPVLERPIAVLHGAGDALMPLDAGRWLARQWPQARLTVFDDCGHAPFLSDPAACGALVSKVVLDA